MIKQILIGIATLIICVALCFAIWNPVEFNEFQVWMMAIGCVMVALGIGSLSSGLSQYDSDEVERAMEKLMQQYDSIYGEEVEEYIEDEPTEEIAEPIPEHRCLSHVLLYGSAGLGKTALANVLRNELEVAYDHSIKFFQTVPSQLKSKTDLDNLMLDVAKSPYCILFVDEVHALSRPIEESLYKALQDGQYDISLSREIDLGDGINMSLSEEAGFMSIDLPSFTCIGATTLFGTLNKPFRDRFAIAIHMQDYTENELKDIMEVRISKARKPTGFKNYIGQEKAKQILRMHIDGLKSDNHIIMSEDAKDVIAKVGFGVARVVNQYTENCLAMARSRNESVVSAEIARETLDLYGVDEDGLNEVDRKIIHHFVINGNAPLGVVALAEAVDVTRGDIEDIYTPKLTKAQILTRGSRSMRVLTKKAYDKYK